MTVQDILAAVKSLSASEQLQLATQILLEAQTTVTTSPTPADWERARLAQERLQQLRSHCSVGDVISPLDEPWEAVGDPA
jgi:hypothetical protein